uniref:BTB domain-containing protein n=1 Tax=Globodera rostochiensis TaxID=31243 RepID=A0A914IGM6_GLORO
MANIYDEFIIVEEKRVMDFTFQNSCTAGCKDVFLCPHINSKFVDLTAFASLEFKNHWFSLYIKDIASHSTKASGPLAQIVSWKWEGGTQKIKENITLNRGGTAEINCRNSPSFVIRILKKREVTENPCPPLSTPDNDLTVQIGDRQVTVSANRLMSVSPVIERMLSVEMKEKQQRTLNLDGHDITMEQFMQFLETVNDLLRHGRTLPNPTNVLYLLGLADYFQIDWLKECCEAHLINCVEIPLIERFLLIERYRLNNLKNFFLHCLNADKLKEFLRANYEQQLLSDASIDKKSWYELIIRFCAKP